MEQKHSRSVHIEELEPFLEEGPTFAREVPLVEANTLHDEDVAAIAHDLRDPLSAITHEVSMLEETLPALDKGARDVLTRIGRNLTHIENLMGDLLDLSAIDAARLELRRERVELGGLVAQVVERMVSARDRHRVQVHFDRVIVVRADPNRIARVVANLVQNALVYSARSARVRLLVESCETRAVVSVSDDGAGLDPDEANRVFEKFRRAASAKRHDGVGPGLYVSRKIIEAHDGKIGVDSVHGRGSRFYFDLPIEESRRM